MTLQNLCTLDLSSNQIPEIPDNIALLQNLQVFDFSNNFIRILRPSLGLLPRLQKINCENNRIIRPTQNIIRQGTQAILEFLRSIR